MLINKKDIIAINKEIGGNGQFSNESSLEFALSIVKIIKAILQISKKNINDINKIMRLMKNVIVP